MDSLVVALMPMRAGGSPSGWGISTPLANGKRNPAASIMLSLLAEMARNEVEVLRERINSGLAQARREGVVLGRHKGSTISNDEFLSKHADIVRLLK
jgi:DNA invertase Pin-like site-specific DNA recombinase